MKNLSLENAKIFAEQKFLQLPELERQWNNIHSRCILLSIKELTDDEAIIQKISPIAWVHDVGKIEGDEGHADKSLTILVQHFELDEIEKDCIKNHGSSANPTSNEGRIFRYADGISLFQKESITFMYWAMAKEGRTFEDVNNHFKKQYEKYLKAYTQSERAITILKSKFLLP